MTTAEIARKLTVQKLNPTDECVCGDYQRDHRNGVGPCRFNHQGFDLTHAGQNCLAFRPVRAILERQSNEQ